MVNFILRNMCSVKIGTIFSTFWVLPKKKSEFGLPLDISPTNHIETVYGLPFRGNLMLNLLFL